MRCRLLEPEQGMRIGRNLKLPREGRHAHTFLRSTTGSSINLCRRDRVRTLQVLAETSSYISDISKTVTCLVYIRDRKDGVDERACNRPIITLQLSIMSIHRNNCFTETPLSVSGGFYIALEGPKTDVALPTVRLPGRSRLGALSTRLFHNVLHSLRLCDRTAYRVLMEFSQAECVRGEKRTLV